MKILFKQKQWIVMQVIFVILGIMIGIIGLLNERDFKTSTGGLASSIQMVAGSGSLSVLFMLLSDLVFNVEYVQGTFLTSLLCGQSRGSWMFRKSVTFYLFVLLQYAIAFAVMSFTAGMITGHFGLEGLRASGTIFSHVTTIELIKEMGLGVLRTLVFASFGVFVTTLLPGKLVVGSIASIGAIFIMSAVVDGLTSVYENNKVLEFIIKSVFLTDPAKSWIYGIFWLVFFVWLSMGRVKRIEIPSRGA